jgi:hypothetical protein
VRGRWSHLESMGETASLLTWVCPVHLPEVSTETPAQAGPQTGKIMGDGDDDSGQERAHVVDGYRQASASTARQKPGCRHFRRKTLSGPRGGQCIYSPCT